MCLRPLLLAHLPANLPTPSNHVGVPLLGCLVTVSVIIAVMQHYIFCGDSRTEFLL